MQIIHVLRKFKLTQWGGTESVVASLAREQMNAGHRVTVVFPGKPDSAECDWWKQRGITPLPYNAVYPYLFLNDSEKQQLEGNGGNLMSFDLMQKLLSQTQADVLHLHTLKRIGAIARVAASRLGIPYVVTLHGSLGVGPAAERKNPIGIKRITEWGKIYGLLYGSRKVISDAAMVMCLTQEDADAVRAQYRGARVRVMPNGVDTKSFQSGCSVRALMRWPMLRGKHVLLQVARVYRSKAQHDAVNLLSSLRKLGLDVTLVLAGSVADEEYYREVMEAVKEQGVSDSLVHLKDIAPESRELADLYAAADVFVLPSHFEPFGVVLLEAMSAGLPIVARRSAGPSKVLDGGKYGALCPDYNSLVNATLESLRAGPRLEQRVSEATKMVSQEYSWSRVAELHQHAYEAAIEDKNTVQKSAGVNRVLEISQSAFAT